MTLENILILSFLLVIVQISIPVIIDLLITNKIKFIYLFSSRDNDQDSLALLWLVSRTIYIPLYILGINYLRTGVWAVALICLIMMSIKFF